MRTWRTVCTCQPHVQHGSTSGTWTDASHALRPITSTLIRKSAVDSAFERPSYRGIVHFAHGVCQVVAFLPLALVCHCLCHLKSAHFSRSVVAFHWCS